MNRGESTYQIDVRECMNSTRTFPAIISSKRSSPYVSSLLLILNIQFIIELPAINDMKEVVSIKWDDYESSIKMK